MTPPPPSVVLVAHGSRAEPANAAHRALAAELARRLDVAVVPAFLELAEPSIPDAIDAAASPGGEVLVHPHFLAPGNHTTRDIPELVAAARTRHPDATIRLSAHTGDAPAMVDLLAGVLAGALGDPSGDA